MIDPSVAEQVRRDHAVSAVAVRHGVGLKRAGREFSGLCPFHTERTPSFTVNDAKGFFHCFGLLDSASSSSRKG